MMVGYKSIGIDNISSFMDIGDKGLTTVSHLV